jgi:hypothetical protein
LAAIPRCEGVILLDLGEYVSSRRISHRKGQQARAPAFRTMLKSAFFGKERGASWEELAVSMKKPRAPRLSKRKPAAPARDVRIKVPVIDAVHHLVVLESERVSTLRKRQTRF